ncbi:MAG: hypothetical protein HKN64_07645 [Woeseiaceae bacterium]|nr:hypothetical protein [Woeseiaceae bacterium]
MQQSPLRTRLTSLAALALLVVFAFPAHAQEMDDLEVTMQVLDDPAELEEAVSKMRAPDDEDSDAVDWDFEEAEGSGEGDGETFEEAETDFEMDDEFEEDRQFEEDAINDEDDYEDGEDVDDDFFD